MADITAFSGAPAPAVSPDPIKLHIRAANALSIAQRELRQEAPHYALARCYLDLAREAIDVLSKINEKAFS